MKTFHVLAAAVLMSIAAVAQPSGVTLKHATVYPAGASLEQEVLLDLQAGTNFYTITSLPYSVYQNSIRLQMPNDVIVEQLTFQTDYLTPPQTSALRDSLTKAQQDKQQVCDAIAAKQKMQQLLEAGVHAGVTPSTPLSSERVNAQLTYFEQRYMQLSQDIAEAQLQQKLLEERIKAIERQLAQSERQPQKYGMLHLTINSPKTQAVSAVLQYFTPLAAWTPSYNLQAANTGDPINIVMKATVSQSTGLDWQDVRLTLSTAEPTVSHSVPELHPWRLEEPHTVARAAKHSSNMVMTALGASNDDNADTYSLYETVVADYVQTSLQGISQSYAIDLPYTIPGNGSERIIPLLSDSFKDVEYLYTIVPSRAPTAYLTASVRDESRLQWPAGEAQLTFHGAVYGTVTLDNTSADEQLTLALGNDPQIAVNREVAEQQSKTSGTQRQVTCLYRTTVRNNKPTAVRIRVKDQQPLATDKQISVVSDKRSTPATRYDAERGIMEYDFELLPGESRELLVGYTVKYPAAWGRYEFF